VKGNQISTTRFQGSSCIIGNIHFP